MNQQDLQRRNPKTWFDARSVMLFTAIAVSSTTMTAYAAKEAPASGASSSSSSTVIGPSSSSDSSTSSGTKPTGGSTKAMDQVGSSHQRLLRPVESLNDVL